MSETVAGFSEDREIERKEAAAKLDFMQREYWRVNNQKQRYMRCPYCSPFDPKKLTLLRRNYYGSPTFCCWMFAKALKAILDRQDEVDKAANAARRACALINTAHVMDQSNGN